MRVTENLNFKEETNNQSYYNYMYNSKTGNTLLYYNDMYNSK